MNKSRPPLFVTIIALIIGIALWIARIIADLNMLKGC